jgi:hypothetical protein
MREGKAIKMDKVVGSECHPFKTQKAKAAYIKLYDDRFRQNGHSLVAEHINETCMAVRSFKRKRMVNPTVLAMKN